MFYTTTNKQGNYVVQWRELHKTVELGIYKTWHDAQAACDKYWDSVIFPVRKKTLARYM